MSDPRPATAQGVLEMHPKGYGFLRNPAKHYAPHPADPYVPAQFVAKFHLAEGLAITGPLDVSAPPRGGPPPPQHRGPRGQRGFQQQRGPQRGGGGPTGPRLAAIETIEGMDPASFRRRDWEELTPIDPRRWLNLETGPEPLTTRVMDLFTPIGAGQRGLIVAPPRTGKTVLLSHVAQAVIQNHPDMHLMVLLVDERPEEVTDLKRSIKGEVIASSSDNDTANHIRIAELVLERAKRLTELGRDVFVLLDSLTRLARAYNKVAGSGRTMSGGVDAKALDVPKRLFGSARAFEEGGTLTILGTALIETGSRMDDVIFQEFKGTGNMELVLDRQLADRRIYPAINLAQSGTRKEERLLPPETLEQIVLLRRSMLQLKPVEAMEGLVRQLSKAQSNAEFLMMVNKFVK